MKSSSVLTVGLVLILAVLMVLLGSQVLVFLQRQTSHNYGDLPRQLCGMLSTTLSGSMTKGAKIVAVDQGSGDVHPLTDALDPSIRATGPSDVGGAACVIAKDSLVQTVYYVPPTSKTDYRNQCHRIQKQYEVYLIDAATRKTVTRYVFNGSMPEKCPSSTTEGVFLRKEGNFPDLGTIAEWVKQNMLSK